MVDSNTLSTTAYKGFTYTSATNTFAFSYTSIDSVGQYSVELACTDGVTENVVTATFTVIAVGVDPIFKNAPLSDIQLLMN